MPDDRDARMVQLLEELRDQHREHLELYKGALKNQAEAVRIQRDLQQIASRRLKLIPGFIVVVLALVLVVLVLLVRVVWRWF
jgi:hypothetical protein